MTGNPSIATAIGGFLPTLTENRTRSTLDAHARPLAKTSDIRAELDQ